MLLLKALSINHYTLAINLQICVHPLGPEYHTLLNPLLHLLSPYKACIDLTVLENNQNVHTAQNKHLRLDLQGLF